MLRVVTDYEQGLAKDQQYAAVVGENSSDTVVVLSALRWGLALSRFRNFSSGVSDTVLYFNEKALWLADAFLGGDYGQSTTTTERSTR